MTQVPIYSTTFDPADSYGRKASHLSRAARNLGLSPRGISFDVRTDGDFFPSTFGGILLGYPMTFPRFGPFAQRGPRVAVTAWESTELPPGWVDNLNKLDHVSVGSTFVRNVFEKGGVNIPISVDPLGIDKQFTYRERNPNEPLTFLVFADRFQNGVDRKGTFKALDAFVNAFGKRDDVHLVIKSRAGYKPIDVTNKNITCVSRDFSAKEMAHFYGFCDILLFPSKGEGFGLPPREFAATGGVPLVTHWGGLTDDLENYAFPLPFTLEEAWAHDDMFSGVGGYWADVNRDDLISLLRTFADHMPRPQLREIGQQFSRFAHKTYSWDRFTSAVLSHYIEVAGLEEDETWRVPKTY